MIATIFTPRDEPIGVVSILSVVAVLVTLGILNRNPDRLSNFAKNFTAVMAALLLPVGIGVLCLQGLDRVEALTSFFVLVSSAFGAGLGCMRSNERRLMLEGLIVSILAGVTIICVAADFGLIFWGRVDAPAWTAATSALVVVAFAFRLAGLLLRLRCRPGAMKDGANR